MSRNQQWWMAAIVVIAAIALAVTTIVMTTGGDEDSMMSSSGHDMGQMMNTDSNTSWDGPMMQMGGMPGMSMSSGGAMEMDEKAFIAMMVPHHQMAVEMAREELDRGTNPKVRAIARQVITDQTKEIKEMESWYRDWYGTDVPSMPMSGAMGMMGMSMDMDDLRAAKDPDRAFLRMMQPHHAGAILMADMVLEGPSRTEVTQLAKQIVAAQATEMGEMQVLREQIAPPLG